VSPDSNVASASANAADAGVAVDDHELCVGCRLADPAERLGGATSGEQGLVDDDGVGLVSDHRRHEVRAVVRLGDDSYPSSCRNGRNQTPDWRRCPPR
jgi:hypothetical protein